MGNPIEIAAVIVWQVSDTYKAAFEVEGYEEYVKIQSEAAVRHLAVSLSYDNLEDEHAQITLRDGGEKVNEILEKELNARLAACRHLISRSTDQPPGLRSGNSRRNAATSAGHRHCCGPHQDSGRRCRHGGNGAGNAVEKTNS